MLFEKNARKHFEMSMEQLQYDPSNLVLIGVGVTGLSPRESALQGFVSFLNSFKSSRGLCLIMAGAGDAFQQQLRKFPAENFHPFRLEFPLGDHVIPQSGRLIVLPPETTGNLDEDGHLKLSLRLPNDGAVDSLLISLSKDLKTHAVGLLFNTRHTDGILGLRAIHEGGGLTLLEMGDVEASPISPEGLAAGEIDHVVPLHQAAPIILQYARFLHSQSKRKASEQLRSSIIAAISDVTAILYQQTNHNFKNYKTSTLVRRIERRMNLNRFNRVEDYLRQLRSSEEERATLFNDLLISVTAFFRDPEAFAALQTKCLQELLTPRTEPFRIWVAGCATGEEAYSLAILCDEWRQQTGLTCEFQIFATDIDTRAMAVARRGIYPQGIAANVSPQRLEKYFQKKSGRYHVAKSIREMCLFSVHNLISDPAFSKLDLISCRNVLIYLGSHLQVKLLPLFHFALQPGGFLFLGPSESLAGNRELFDEIDGKNKIWRRRHSAIDSAEALPDTEWTKWSSLALPQSKLNETDLHEVAQRIILGEFSPEWAVIDEDAKIIAVSEDVGQFLRISGGAFENNIIKLAKTGLRVGLRAALNESIKRHRRVDHDRVSLRVKGGLQRLRVSVQPMPRMGSDVPLYMVAFQKEGALLARQISDDSGFVDSHDLIVQQLERELASTRADLEKTVHELETANQELKSSNEELTSINEELQTAIEELESSKEEVMAANTALAETKNDLENLLASSDTSMIFVDAQMNVRAFSAAATKIYNLIDSDIGRPLWHITHQLASNPEVSLKDLKKGESQRDARVKTIDGRVFLRRLMPYLDRKEGTTQGMVITFTDITKSLLNEYNAQIALEAGNMGTWKWHLETDSLNLDPIVQRLLALNPEQDSYTVAEALQHLDPLDRTELEQEARKAQASQLSFRCDCRVSSAEKPEAWVAIVGGPDPLQDNQITGVAFDVTKIFSTLERLTASEFFSRTIFENSPDCVTILDRNGNLLSINQQGCRLLEIEDAQKLEGRHWAEIWPPASQSLIQRSLSACLAGQQVHFQAECPTAKGHSRWWDVAIAGVPDSQGKTTKIVSVSRDITANKLAEQALAESSEKLRAAMEVAEIGIAIVDYEKDLVQFDRIAARILGVPYGTTLTREGFHERFHPEDRLIINDLAAQSFNAEGERGYFVEARLPREFGTTWVNLRKRNYFSPAGVLQKGLVAIQDTTDLKAAEAKLREHHERLSYTLAATKAGVWEWMVAEEYLIWSNETYAMYGLVPDEDGIVDFNRWTAMIEAKDRERFLNSIDRLFTNQKSDWIFEYRINLPTKKERWLQSRGSLEYDRDGKPLRMSGIVFDITERKEFEIALQEARDVAEAATRTRGEFLANMSHEIRTPMTAILGHADILAEQLVVPDDLQSLEIIRRNGRHLLEIINDILDLSKIDAGHLELSIKQLRLSELIGDIRSLMDFRAAEKGLKLTFRFATLVPKFIETDPVRVRQILINLIGNAIKFTNEGAVVVSVAYRQATNQLEFEVADTGIGMAANDIERLFTPFIQVDSSTTRQFQGTGLGLAISRRLASALGGDITVESKLGKGSTFTLTIYCGTNVSSELVEPKIDLSVQDLELVQPTISKIDASVLIVDDRRDIRLLGQHFVEKAGGRVSLAADGQAAVDLLMSPAGDNIDIVLMDMQMPVMDGYLAVKTLRQRGFTKPIIALTANAMKEDREKCLAAGCDDYTTKPLDGAKLVRLIAKLLYQHTVR